MINFIKYRFVYFAISGLVLIPGMISLMLFGLKPSIDFTGGTVVEVKNEKIILDSDKEKLTKILQDSKIEVVEMQERKPHQITIKAKPIERSVWDQAKDTLTKDFGAIEEIQFETVGPVLGRELLEKTAIASVIAMSGILLYVAWAFKEFKFGISAVLALIHDVLVVVGIFSLLGHFYNVEVDVLFVTAVLTTMSFSVHDTIVVFDRIRESLKSSGGSANFTMLVNRALTETMTRSLNNSLTIIFMLLALSLMGGDTIRWFVVALLIGTVSGTYSSPFVATPILYYLTKKKE